MKTLRIIILAASAAIMLTGCSSEIDRAAVRGSIRYQMNTYPESRLKDLYKNFFQDAFGPGHLAGSGDEAMAAMAAYLQSECEEAALEASLCPEYELTGWHGRFYRVNLSVINDGKVPMDVFLDAFMASAETFTLPDLDDWKKEWDAILSEITKEAPDLPDFINDKEAIEQLLSGGEYASHHSKAYELAYHPHYRLIEKSIFETRLLPFLTE